ncbi:MAG: tyrosine-type recombinase/integrase [Chloroflexi bacterium]|nr:tyrosine-type recombinase/integrase [Chloroflexota bacterium]
MSENLSDEQAGPATADAVVDYLAAAARARAPRTLPMLRSDLAELAGFLARRGVLAVSDLQRRHLHAWARHLRGRRLAPSTVARKISHARGWCAFLVARCWLAESPATWLRTPAPRPQPAPAALDADVLLAACAGDDALSLRDHALVEILYAAGLRASEVARLRVGDVALDGGQVIVPGRRAGQRVLPLHRAACLALARYIARVRADARPAEALFLSRRGTPLRERDVRARVRALGRRAGVPRATPDLLRWQLARDLAARGANVRAIAQLLGHARLSTTRRGLAR